MSQNCGSEPERKEIYISEVRHTSVAMETLSSTESQKRCSCAYICIIN